MVSKVEKQRMLAKKLQILKAIIRSKSENKHELLSDAANYINELKNKIEEMTVACEALGVDTTHEDVRVEKNDDDTYNIRVMCKNSQDLLVSLMEAFDGLGLKVLHANMNAYQFFSMEAMVKAEGEGVAVDVEFVTRTIYMVVRNSGASS